MKKLQAMLAAALILASLIPSHAVSQGGYFRLENLSFLSSTGGDVYPGSANARLVVEVRYVGATAARSPQGCLEPPAGFSVALKCVRARDPGGSYTTRVEYGDVMHFTYYASVDRFVAPGAYSAALNVSALVNDVLVWEVIYVTLVVVPYPELKVELVDSYWAPGAYPGTSDTSLVLVFRSGETVIDEATLTAKLPGGFHPATARATVRGVSKHSSFTAVLPGIDVSPEVTPGTYYAEVTFDATAITDDGVRYTTSLSLRVPVRIGEPPPLGLRLVSSGWSGSRVPTGSANSEYRVILRLVDTATISSLVAKLILPPCASFLNGSRSSVTYLNRPVGYGETFELSFGGINLACSHTEVATLVLDVLASRDGSEFWATITYTLLLVVQNPVVDLRVVSAYWSPGPAFPGSSSLSLVVVLENYDYVSLFGGVATLSSGITKPKEAHLSGVAASSFSRAALVFRGLSVDPSVAPGAYEATLSLSALADSGRTIYVVLTRLTIQLRVETPPVPRLEVLNYGWRDGKAFAGSIGNSLRVVLRNSDPGVLIRSLRASIDPPECFKLSDLGKTFVASADLAYGESLVAEFSGIDLACGAGVYRVSLSVEVLGELSSSTFWRTLAYDLALEVEEPALNVEVLDSGWATGLAYGSSRRLVPYLVLQTYTRDSVRSLSLRVRFLNAALSDGRCEAALFVDTPLAYGSSVMVRLPAVDVEGAKDFVVAEVEIEALVQYGQTLYNASRRFTVRFAVREERNLAVAEAHVTFRGEPSPLLPTARGVSLSVTIANVSPEPLSVLNLSVRAPDGLLIRGVEGDCLRAALAGGSSCGLTLSLEALDRVAPGRYLVEIALGYAKRLAGAVLYGAEVLHVPVVVEPLEAYAPEVELLSAYWGVQQPVPVYPSSRYVPLTVVMINAGRYEALGVAVTARSESLEPVVSAGDCAARLPPGATCSTILYFNVPAATVGRVELEVLTSYRAALFGAHAVLEKVSRVALYVETFPGAGSYLKPISWGWLNNYNVFPRTDNATFVVTVANRLPYSLVGLIAELYLPGGFSGSEGSVSLAYVDGPLRGYSSAQLSFRVSVGDVAPGTYRVTLRLDYVAQSGGPGVRVLEEHELSVVVVDDRNAVELVNSGWIEGSAEPGTYGALLHIVVRNNYVDFMGGVYLELLLPDGVLSAVDNSTVARSPPASPQLLQVLQRSAPVGRVQPEALAALLQQAGPQVPYRRGDLVEFIVPVNILVEKVGRYYADAVLHYVDQWGTPRSCRLRIPIVVLGGVRYVAVDLDGGTLRISSRFTKAAVKLLNVGSGPAYNVYVVMLPHPQLPVLVVTPSVHYIDRLDPGREVVVNVTVAYNPMGVYVAAGAQAVVSYGTVPLVVGVVYRDAGGRLKVFNTSIAVVVEPFIDLVVRDLRATATADTLRVSGTLVNLGSATAYRVSVRVCTEAVRCTETFVGDVEPGAQRAFGVSMPTREPPGAVRVTVAYYNVYNELQLMDYRVTVSTVVPQTQVVAQQVPQYPAPAESWIVVAAVVAFLALVGYVMYKVVTSYTRRLKQALEVPPP